MPSIPYFPLFAVFLVAVAVCIGMAIKVFVSILLSK